MEADFDAYRPEGRSDIVLMMGLLEYRADPGRDLARLSELASEKVIVNIARPFRWRTAARRVRHRLRAAPPAFHVHSPAAHRGLPRGSRVRRLALDRGLVRRLQAPRAAIEHHVLEGGRLSDLTLAARGSRHLVHVLRGIALLS